tara:strand:+ start:2232 stop:2600 length:369 start_codon:yes stop_codon:yes gene_type:complete
MSNKPEPFSYNATIVKIIDGDTVDALVDVGFSIMTKKRIRFRGINTPESRTRDKEEKVRGLAAKDRVVELLSENDNKFVLKSYGVGKYGRCLGELFVEGHEESVNQVLINEGHAVEYWGGKR